MAVHPSLPIFTRPARISKWDRFQLAGPMEYLTLREWEESVLCCSLAESLRKLLVQALTQPASPVCRRLQVSLAYWRQSRASEAQPSENARARRGQAALAKPWVDGAFSGQTAATSLRELLRKELAAIWYIVDTPALACTGLSRDMLLVEHGRYLRTLLETLAKKPGTGPLHYELGLALAELEGRRPLSVVVAQPQRSRSIWKFAGQPRRT